MSFSGWDYNDDEYEDENEGDIYNEKVFKDNLPERRSIELKKLMSVYKALTVGQDIKQQLQTLIDTTAGELDDYAFQKQLRFNKPKTSLLDFFRPNNKVVPQPPKPHLKSLPIEQADEFTEAKKLLADILAYIQKQKTLELMVKAVANVTRDSIKPICYVEGTTIDQEISLDTAIKTLEKGKPYIKYAGPETKTIGPIKDTAILKILVDTGNTLLNTERLIKRAMDKANQQVDTVYQDHITKKYDEMNPGHQAVPITAKLEYLLVNLKTEKFEKFKSDMKADLNKTNIPLPIPLEKPHHRRNAW
jgi:hypothetical protein